jgi:hypothetical protein
VAVLGGGGILDLVNGIQDGVQSGIHADGYVSANYIVINLPRIDMNFTNLFSFLRVNS